jgi:hypothetical protein
MLYTRYLRPGRESYEVIMRPVSCMLNPYRYRVDYGRFAKSHRQSMCLPSTLRLTSMVSVFGRVVAICWPRYSGTPGRSRCLEVERLAGQSRATGYPPSSSSPLAYASCTHMYGAMRVCTRATRCCGPPPKAHRAEDCFVSRWMGASMDMVMYVRSWIMSRFLSLEKAWDQGVVCTRAI